MKTITKHYLVGDKVLTPDGAGKIVHVTKPGSPFGTYTVRLDKLIEVEGELILNAAYGKEEVSS